MAENMSEASTVDGLLNRLSKVEPWDIILPANVNTWLENAATSKSTTKNILYATLLTTTSSLMSISTLEMYEEHSEYPNLFVLILAPSASGKSPACTFGCTSPLLTTVERSCGRDIIIDESTVAGLFNKYAERDRETTPLLCLDEAFQFLRGISIAKNTADLSVGRMCKLYDGQPWLKTKGKKGACYGTHSARMSALLYTTPPRLLTEVWPKLSRFGDGITSRFLVIYDEKPEGAEGSRLRNKENASRALSQTAIKTMDTVLERIALEHDTPIKYTFTDEAKEAFYQFDEGRDRPSDGDKSIPNALKVVMTAHVLLHRLDATLKLQPTPTPREITEETLHRGLAFFESWATYSSLAELSGKGNLNGSVCINDITEEDVLKKIFELDGPFVSPRHVVGIFLSLNRPSSSFVAGVFRNLSTEQLGWANNVPQPGSPDPICVFYKVFPNEITEENLMRIQLSRDDYRESFQKKERGVTATQRARYTPKHPKGEEQLRHELGE